MSLTKPYSQLTDKQRSAAIKFNESVDYFVLNYGCPIEDCTINLLTAYRDLSILQLEWAASTIRKTIARMPKFMLDKVYECLLTREWNGNLDCKRDIIKLLQERIYNF